MKITKIKIDSFGALRDREFAFSDGINLIEGSNESGKTSLAMFIKFLLYGISGRASDLFPTGERKRFLNWDTGRAEGFMEFDMDGAMYRIERSAAYTGDGDAVRERKSVISLETGTAVKFTGEPGEYFFGVPESVFVNTVFVRQLGSNAIDNGEIISAVENILGSADEKISMKKALSKLDSLRRQLMHKTGAGGEIPELEEEIARLDAELAEAEEKNASLIAARSALDSTVDQISKLEGENLRLEKILQIREDLDALIERDRMRDALGAYEREKAAFTEAQSAHPGEKIRTGIAMIRAGLEQEKVRLADAEEKIKALQADVSLADGPSAEECDIAERDSQVLTSRGKNCRTVGIIFAVTAVIAGAGTAAAYVMSFFNWAILAALCGLLLIPAVIFSVLGASSKKKLRALLNSWGAVSAEELCGIIENRRGELRQGILSGAQLEGVMDTASAAQVRIGEYRNEALSLCALLPSLADADTGSADTLELLELCEKEEGRISGELMDRRETLAASRGECQVMASRLDKYDFDDILRRQQEVADSAELAEARSLDRAAAERRGIELRMNRDKLRIAYGRQTEYEKILAEGRAVSKSPTDIAESLEAKRAELEEKRMRFDAIRLAMETLEESGERLRSEMMPRIVKKASELFAAATFGKYSSVGVSAGFEMTVSDGDTTRDADYLSAGSADAAYICLRLALAEVIFGGKCLDAKCLDAKCLDAKCLDAKCPPLIFDESFAKIDEERASRLFDMLGGSGIQTVVFSCRSAEKEIVPAGNVVSL